MPSPSLVWFRDDLRLADNPALSAALDRGEPVIGLYVLEEGEGIRALGGAARWWLHGSLTSLGESLRERGSTLVLRRGRAAEAVAAVAAEIGAGAVFWNRRYGGAERDIDAGIKAALRGAGVEVASFSGSLLFEPWTVQTGSGTPYAVFTPFWRACQNLPAPRAPLSSPDAIPGLAVNPLSDELGEWELLPTAPDWAGGLRERWQPGEPTAQARLHDFLTRDLDDYDRARDEPSGEATSLLSPRLRWGELSPHQVWHAALAHRQAGAHPEAASRFVSELGWREFAWHTLFHFPDLATKNWRAEFDAFPWPRLNRAHLEAWQRGRTGVALVDAGMRELWHTGHMHNRVRMVTASFLVKNLLIDWRHGEQWFWDTLVDADAASNAFNWQWVAGSGADAAPYFRIFNPERQRERFDPHDEYVRRWAPEYLAGPASDQLFTDDLEASVGAAPAGPPAPIVDLADTRRQALDAYDAVKRSR